MAQVISLAEYKQAKGIVDDAANNQLNAIIPMVSEAIETYCEREFGKGIYTEQNEGVIDSQGRFFFKVKNRPIDTVQSITVKFYGTQVQMSLDVNQIDLFAKEGYMYYSHAYDTLVGIIRDEYKENHYYTITYSGGLPVPKAVKLAAITAVSDMYEMMQASKLVSGEINPQMKSVKIGDYAESYETSANMFRTFHDKDTGALFSQTVLDLLNPYVHKGQSW